MPKSSTRLDILLVDRGLAPSRERAQALVLAAKVLVNGRVLTKAGQKVPEDAVVQLLGEPIPYVSRGGLKLEHALRTFGIDVSGKTAMDVGASTGGFTDCLLSFGARKVYAVDVGYGQLAMKLRNDPRVIILERSNIRYLPGESAPEPVQVVTIDVSFISLRLVIPSVLRFMAPESTLIALIKPQFEAGRQEASRGGGVIRDPILHEAICEGMAEFARSAGLRVIGITPSPILGPKGNREFLIVAERENRGAEGKDRKIG